MSFQQYTQLILKLDMSFYMASSPNVSSPTTLRERRRLCSYQNTIPDLQQEGACTATHCTNKKCTTYCERAARPHHTHLRIAHLLQRESLALK